MPHFSFIDAIRRIAESDWGLEVESPSDLDKYLLKTPDKLAAFAILDLLRKLSTVFTASQEELDQERRERRLKRPKDALRVDGLKLGDLLYQGNMECGLTTSVVIGHDDEGYPVVIDVAENEYGVGHIPYHVTEDYGFCRTATEALLAAAKRDIAYWGRYVQWSRDCIQAIESGGDLAKFQEGHGGFEDDDDTESE